MNNIHTCPVEQIRYHDACKVNTCPAHDKKAESGCIYQQLKEISMFNIGHRWKMTNPEIKRSYKKGVKVLTEAAKFYHLANQNFVAPLHFCKKCGIKGQDCINILRCERRFKFATKQCKKLPMRVLNKPTPVWFWPTVSNPALQEFFKPKTVEKAKNLLARKIK